MKRPPAEFGVIGTATPTLETLVDALTDSLKAIDRRRPIWLGLSGGIDSTALLLAAAALHKRVAGLTLRAIHVNHHLQAEAETFEAHCLRLAQQLGIRLSVLHAKIDPPPGESLEAAARDARYAAFERLIQPGESLLLAHHREDQAETLLINLIRGSGVEGIRAMSTVSLRSGRFILRPFLSLSRETLKAALDQAGIATVEDPSNESRRFDRNFLRHEILPALRLRWPAIDRTLSRSASLCAESAEIQAEHQVALLSLTSKKGRLSLSALAALSERDQRLAVRGWLQSEGFRPPPSERLRHLIHAALAAGPDRSPSLQWPGAEIRRYRQQLFVMQPLEPVDPDWSLVWTRPEDSLPLPSGLGRLRLEAGAAAGLPDALWQRTIRVRLRRGGETIQLPGRAGHHALRKLFQEAGTPPWIRERTPLIFVDDTLMAIGDQWLGDAAAFGPPEGRFSRIVWERPVS